MEKYISLIASRYGIIMQQMLLSNHECAKYKVLSFLYSLAIKYGTKQKDGSIYINKIPSLTDIGALTNVHRTNVSAYINELESLKIISRYNHSLTVYNIEIFEKIIEELTS